MGDNLFALSGNVYCRTAALRPSEHSERCELDGLHQFEAVLGVLLAAVDLLLTVWGTALAIARWVYAHDGCEEGIEGLEDVGRVVLFVAA